MKTNEQLLKDFNDRWKYLEWLYWRGLASKCWNPSILKIKYEQKQWEANLKYFNSER